MEKKVLPAREGREGPDIKENMAAGWSGAGIGSKGHVHGYNFMPYFQGKQAKGPRDSISPSIRSDAIRENDGKPSFASSTGHIATGKRDVTNGTLIANLRMDP